MSMPTIEINPIDPTIALNNILASIALVEAGASHILNAEGEKIELAIQLAEDDPMITAEQLTALNASVANTLAALATLEQALQEKLAAVLGFDPDPVPNAASEPSV